MSSCRIFTESSTLEELLQGHGAPDGALVIMDRGIATEDNIATR